MKYPITPDYIKSAPKPIEKLFQRLEEWILQDICERFKVSETATDTAIEQIRVLQRRGYSYKDIKKFIQQTVKLSDAQYDTIMQDAIQRNQRYYSSVLGENMLMQAAFEAQAMQDEINAIIAQTKGTLENITQSLGFCVKKGGAVTFMPIAKAYQQILSDADMRVWSGAQSYSEAIRDSVSQLADSGIRYVTWADDERGVYHTDHADVAARRAIMTGITQVSSKFSEQAREAVPTEYMEITAHQGARDKDRAGIPWANHKAWQGKVYSTRTADKYPSVYEVCGWGDVQGLEGANCRHLHYPFWDGISERTYTDQELANIDPPPCTYQGKKYTAYQATQKQRQIERELRKVKRELICYDAIGDKQAYQTTAIKYGRLNEMYSGFSKAAGLREQSERGNIAEFTPADGKKATNAAKNTSAKL